MSISCEMEGNNFPFDTQNCQSPWVIFPLYSTDIVILKGNVDHEHAINYEKEYRFHIHPYKLGSFSNKNRHKILTKSLSLIDQNWISSNKEYSIVGFEIEFKRLQANVLWMYYLPSILVVLTGSISFVIPPNAIPGRMGLLVTLFLVQIDLVQSLSVSLDNHEDIFLCFYSLYVHSDFM